MDNRQMDSRLTELRQYQRAAAELKKQMEAIEAEVKAELESRGAEEAVTEHYKVTWKRVSTVRLDTRALKAERPEIYARYAVSGESRRFLIT